MPPKFDPTDPEIAALISLFRNTGLSQAKAVETAKSSKNATALKEIITTNNLADRSMDDKKLSLVSGLAVQGGKLGAAQKSYIVDAIVDGRLKSAEQVNGAQTPRLLSIP
jgi:glutaminyl-tRNA synthetase